MLQQKIKQSGILKDTRHVINKSSQVWIILEINKTAAAKLRLLLSAAQVTIRDQRH